MTALDLVLTNLGPETAFGTGVKGPQKASEVYLRQNTRENMRQNTCEKNMRRFECLKIISATKAAQAAMRRRGVAMAWIAGKLTWLFAIGQAEFQLFFLLCKAPIATKSGVNPSLGVCLPSPASSGVEPWQLSSKHSRQQQPHCFWFRFHAEIGNLPKLHRIKPSFVNTIATCMRPLSFLTTRKKKNCFPKTKNLLDNFARLAKLHKKLHTQRLHNKRFEQPGYMSCAWKRQPCGESSGCVEFNFFNHQIKHPSRISEIGQICCCGWRGRRRCPASSKRLNLLTLKLTSSTNNFVRWI